MTVEQIEMMWIVFVVIISFGSLAWRLTEFGRHKTQLASATMPRELHYHDSGDTASITGNIGPYRIDVNTRLAMKYSKHQHVAVEGTLKLTDAPSGFCLSPEGTLTGVQRLGDKQDIEFNDPDFDNAFWVQAEDPELLADYLTEDRRKALLHWLKKVGDGSIDNGVLSRSGAQSNGMDFIGTILGQFLGLSFAFRGDSSYHASTAEMKSGWVAAQRFRRLAWWTGLMALAFWILPLEVHLPEWVVSFDHILMVFSAATAIFAIAGQQKTVVVLCTILGFTSSLAFVAAGGMLLLQAHYVAGSIIAALALLWLLCWIGTAMQMKSLKV